MREDCYLDFDTEPCPALRDWSFLIAKYSFLAEGCGVLAVVCSAQPTVNRSQQTQSSPCRRVGFKRRSTSASSFGLLSVDGLPGSYGRPLQVQRVARHSTEKASQRSESKLHNAMPLAEVGLPNGVTREHLFRLLSVTLRWLEA